MRKIATIFRGKTKPSVQHVGTNNSPITHSDEFGEIWEGNVRSCLINTRWGQLRVPKSWMKKKIVITVNEVSP